MHAKVSELTRAALLGIETIYRRPRTSIPARGSLIFPYLLGGSEDRSIESGVGE
jgi:hypothetical protein